MAYGLESSILAYMPFLLIPSVLLGILVWELFWKGLGLWVSARTGQRNWFISILVLNTLGLLPIIYLVFFQKILPSKGKVKRKKK